METITFQVDTRLAELLSKNYTSSEKAIKELVDNAWDADAEKVTIIFPKPLTDKPIIIEDHGSGMTREELINEYLYIASDRRKRRGDFTSLKHRKVKGKKGIGKFAGLMAANTMKLETWKKGQACEFVLHNSDFNSVKDIENLPINLDIKDCDNQLHGTRITLFNLDQSLAFPNPDKFRQLLIQEYGREEGFEIIVDQKQLGIDDIQGITKKYETDLPLVGHVKLEFTISNQKAKLKQPGISIRVSGKVVGKPSFFGLDKADDFPVTLLEKIYGEVEADGLINHVTESECLIENSEPYKKLTEYIQPILRERIKEEYGQQLRAAYARLQKKIQAKLAGLPEYKRQYVDKALKAVLSKYSGEPESKLEPIVNVILDALEKSDYRTLLDYIYEADDLDITKLAAILDEFGLAEIAIVGEQASTRLKFLDHFEYLCLQKDTDEKLVHTSLEKNLWIFGIQYSVFSSNKTLKRKIEEYFDKKYIGDRANKRPDLMLNVNHANEYLLIEFKRPDHILKYEDYQQATRYRNDFAPFTNAEIKVVLIGGKKGKDLPVFYNKEPNTDILIFDEIISNARNQLNWLLKQLGGEEHA